jgi:uncharacterized protein (TIGR02391 family)
VYYVALHVFAGGAIRWEAIGRWPSEDAAGLTISYVSANRQPRRRESVNFLAETLRQHNVGWFTMRGNAWIVDLDKLIRELDLPADAEDLRGLTGIVVTEPEFDVDEREIFGELRKEGVVRLVFTQGTLQDATENETDRRGRLFDDRHYHSEVAGVARQLFVDGHFRESVLNTCVRINGLVRAKSGSTEDGVSLMTNVFGSRALLKVNALTTQDQRNEQTGVMQLFVGMIQAIRNPPAHELLPQTESGALELLGFLSFLVHTLDRST